MAACTRLKDSSSTDVVVHGGIAATSFYQCGDVYELDARTLEPLGKAGWVDKLTPGWGVSAHTKVDEATGELLFFGYSPLPPYLTYHRVSAEGKLIQSEEVAPSHNGRTRTHGVDARGR